MKVAKKMSKTSQNTNMSRIGISSILGEHKGIKRVVGKIEDFNLTRLLQPSNMIDCSGEA